MPISLNAGCCPIGSEDVSFTGFKFRGDRKDFGELKVDKAEFSEMRGVGDIAWFGVIVSNSEFIL